MQKIIDNIDKKIVDKKLPKSVKILRKKTDFLYINL